MDPLTVNRFREARGRRLRAQIEQIAESIGRDITILDIGGRADYWKNVGTSRIKSICILNTNSADTDVRSMSSVFTSEIGDARQLSNYKDQFIDLAHSNSVIEHVGGWPDIQAMAREVQRVGRHGWIQTPAWEFPIEPHFKAPFLHWFGQPLRRRMMFMSSRYRRTGLSERRMHVDRINLLSFDEVSHLFEGKNIFIERFLAFPKSYVVHW